MVFQRPLVLQNSCKPLTLSSPVLCDFIALVVLNLTLPKGNSNNVYHNLSLEVSVLGTFNITKLG